MLYCYLPLFCCHLLQFFGHLAAILLPPTAILSDVVWDDLGKVVRSNARFWLTNLLEVHLDHSRMPGGKGRGTEKTKGRSLDVSTALKKYHYCKSGFIVFDSCMCNCYGPGER